VRTQAITGNGVTYQGGAQYLYLRIRQADGDRAWTAPIWFEPMGTSSGGGAGVISLSLVVDESAETAQVTNTGTAPVELAGWSLVSVRGIRSSTNSRPTWS